MSHPNKGTSAGAPTCYGLDLPTAEATAIRGLQLRSGVVGGALLTAVMGGAAAQEWLHPTGHPEVLVGAAVIVTCTVGVMSVVTYWRTRNTLLAQLRSFRIHLHQNLVSRSIAGFDDLRIPYAELTRVAEDGHGGLLLYGKAPNVVLHLPHTLERLAEARAIIAQFHAVEAAQTPSAVRQWLTAVPLGLLPFAASSVLCFTVDPVIAVVAAVGLYAPLAILLRSIQRDPNISTAGRRMVWGVAAWLGLAPLVRLLWHLTN